MEIHNSGLNTARKIVANLAWRYRFARTLYRQECNKDYSVQIRARMESSMYEAWNAYVTSKKILFGIEP